MKSSDSRGSGRRGRGSRRSSRSRSESNPPQAAAPAKKTLWQKIIAFFKPEAKPAARPVYPGKTNGASSPQPQPRSEPRTVRKPEAVDVTTPKLYIGNLSYDATENDLSELFNGVGAVRAAEIVSHKHTEKSKGFAFVTMATVDEAKRAVTELHDKEFMGRKLVVSGAKTSEREPNYRG